MAKSPNLADWLEQSMERITPAGGSLGPAVLEAILRIATAGGSGMLESVLSGVARNAVATGQPIGELLQDLQAMKTAIWERLEDEIDPAYVWEWLFELEPIFQTASMVMIKSYVAALDQSHQTKVMESARVHQAAERDVLTYAAKLARANRQLAKLEQAKTDFISIAAHELKTPLSVVQGYVDMYGEQTEAQTSEQNGNQTIWKGMSTGVERLSTLIDNLLDVSAIETNTLVLEMGLVAVGSLVKLVVQRLDADAQARQHQFVVEVEPDLPPISTDSKRLYQVIHQLISNAIKYTPDNGQISVAAYLEANQKTDQNAIKIEVGDTGIGIAPEDRDQIFNKFYRASEAGLHSTGQFKFKGAGPGLGLSIAKGIIAAFDGELWAESPGYDEVNCPGSVFHIRLPLITDPALDSADVAAS